MQQEQYEMKGMHGEPLQPPPPGYGTQPPPPGYASQPMLPPQPQPIYPQTQTVIVPQAVVMNREEEYVPDNTVIAIISIFCCCILGIIATVKAQSAKNNKARGDIEQARLDSNMAKKLAIAAIVTGCIVTFIVIFVTFILPLILAGVAVGTTSSNF